MQWSGRRSGVVAALLGIVCLLLSQATLLPDPCFADFGDGVEAGGCCAGEADAPAADACGGASPETCGTLCCSGVMAAPEAPFVLVYSPSPEFLTAVVTPAPQVVCLERTLRPPITG